MGAGSTTVRVSVATRERLRRLAERRSVSVAAILDELAARGEQDEILAWASDLRGMSEERLQAYRAELAEWDGVTVDGLRGSG